MNFRTALSSLTACFGLMSIPTSAQAQPLSASDVPSTLIRALPEALSNSRAILVRQPGLTGANQFFSTSRKLSRLAGSTRETADLPELTGHVVYSNPGSDGERIHSDGIYTFTPDGGNFVKISGDNAIYGNYGAVWHEGIYYQSGVMTYNDDYWVYSMATYNDETWELLKYNTSVRPPSIGYTYTTVDGLVYGCFLTEMYTQVGGCQFGVMTMDEESKYPVKLMGEMPELILSMAADAEGRIYGFGASGALYEIDKSTGQTAKVGDTGVKPQYLSSAAYDNFSGKIYWNACPADGGGYMYEVDPATAQSTLICRLEADDEIVGMKAEFRAQPKAPGAPADVTSEFYTGSLTGNICFTIPSTTYDGEVASGSVNYSVRANGQTVAQGTGSYGAHVSAPVILSQAENCNIVVVLRNEAGYGPSTMIKSFIGEDTPVAPEVSAVYSDGKFTVTWNPVTSTVNGGYMDADKVKYSVVRMPDNMEVASGITDTEFIDPVVEPDQYTIYTYHVYADYNGNVSGAGISNKVGLGAMHAPWTENFEDPEVLERFTIIDVHGDKNTWVYNASGQNMRAESSFTLPKDDWLITPAIRLEAGKAYRISIEAYSSKGYEETFDIRLGDAPSVDAMTTVIVPETSIKLGPEEAAPFGDYVTVPVTGNYYVGIHVFSPTRQFNMYVNCISVEAPIDGGAPAGVTDIVATPAKDGTHNVTMVGKAPAVDMLGNTLNSIDNIVIKRGDETIETIAGVGPGQTFSYTDVPADAGEYTYCLYAANASGIGRPEYVTVYAGVNIPAPVRDVTIAETSTPGTVTIAWEAPTVDVAGNALPQGQFTYTLVNTGSPNVEEIVSGLTSTDYTWRVNNGSVQDFAGVAVFAVSESGASDGVSSPLLPVGKPYELPYKESFDNGSASSLLGVVNYNGSSENVGWGIYKDGSSLDNDADGTNGFAVGKGTYSGNSTMLYTGMIDLTEAANPAFSFYLYNLCGEEGQEDINEIDVMVREVGDGNEWTSVRRGTVHELCKGDPLVWRKVKTSLYNYRGKRVMVGIKVTVRQFAYTFVDGLCVAEDFTHNLIADAVSAPASVNRGEDFEINLKVINQGAQVADAFTLRLFKNDSEAPVATLEGGPLDPGTESVYTMTQALSMEDPEENTFHIEVYYAADEEKEDNISATVCVKKKVSGKGRPTDLTIANEDEDHAVLAWVSPDQGQEYETVTDDFESYPSFVNTGVGDWTLIDGDEGPIGGFRGIDIPGIPAQSQQPFFLFDCSGSEFGSSSFSAHSGTKYLASMYLYNFNQVDDWAVSPLLSGREQTVRFFARSYSASYPEAIEMLYSTNGTEMADFIKVEEVGAVSSEWTEYTFDIPAGAKYFAIRCVSADAFMLEVDDVTFEQKYDKPIGFNIYRDDVKIGDTPATVTTYTDMNASGATHTYCVTAVYASEESEPSNVVSFSASVSGIESMVKIYTSGATIVVEGAEGRKVAVTDVAGRLMYSGQPDTTLRLSVDKGIHLVRVGGMTCKVIVR